MKTYDKIVAPLKKIEKDLKKYASIQLTKRLKYCKEQAILELNIIDIDAEIAKSDITSTKISKLLDTTKK